jgi:tryptophan halogenase
VTNKIVIVGGGTAGWMTAAYLKKALPALESITLIESSSIRTIGVGEATFSTAKLFFDFLGLQERDWMPACGATYKLAIKYLNWTAKPGYFYHPFQRYELVAGFTAAEWWLKLRREEPFDRACYTIPGMCDTYRSPRYLDGTVFDEQVQNYFHAGAEVPNNVIAHHKVQYPYGYHFDASRVADYLKDYAINLGVRRIVDDVLAVVRADDGSISYLETAGHGQLKGDLFVDCSGFRSLLLGQTLKEPFISFTGSLPNDRAVALQVPTDRERDGIPPYTQAAALGAGWAWTIPLYERNGCGYVYASDFRTSEEAEKELRAFLGPAADGCEANHIRMRVGRSRNSWVKNCVAIGLSSAFVEPLESTGIFFIQHAIEELVNHFPAGPAPDEGLLISYNKVVSECIDGVREFLILHYCATDRADTEYWKALKSLRLPESLEERMKIFGARLPGLRNIYQPFHGFEAYSWSVILLGMNRVPKRHLSTLDVLDSAQAERMFDGIKQRSKHLIATLPSHYEYLRAQHEGSVAKAPIRVGRRRASEGYRRRSPDEIHA